MEQGIASDNRQKQTLKLIFRNNKTPKGNRTYVDAQIQRKSGDRCVTE
jgi:hypothetical protein